MANPHPTKQRKPASDALSARLKKKFPAYVARQRQPGEAGPRVSDAMRPDNIYKPVAMVAPIR